jgi:solute carrier family 9B (sodium/hydrogen exchanger), member 1/2
MKEYEKIMQRKGLPNVGQLVRSKKFNTIWRVMEKRETWRSRGVDAKTQEPRWDYAIYLSFWKVQLGVDPGLGGTMGFLYGLEDNTFEENWVIVS